MKKIFPDIKIKLNGYTACALLGKARAVAVDMTRNRQIYTVEASTPVEKGLESLEMHHVHVKVRSSLHTVGYLVYFSTGVSGWFELMPLTDKRFSKYEEELLKLIEECSG